MRSKLMKRLMPVVLAAILSISSLPGSLSQQIMQSPITATAASVAVSNGLTDRVDDGAILHAWCWSFDTIRSNMKDIAEAGFTAVQTSPANSILDTNKTMQLDGNGHWYYQYQPTDWKIGNYQLGSRDQFAAMCQEADKYGIKIIVDVVPNHTTPTTSKVSSALINAAGGDLYHANGFTAISNYKDRYQCTTGQMGGLPDVNTENQGFQKYFLQYLNDLVACGCDGFRYDTAKHIGVPSDPKDSKNTRGVNDFWQVVTGKKSVSGVSLSNAGNLFIYGEVLQDDGIPYAEYSQYMKMTASSYGNNLRKQVKNNDFSVNKISSWNHETPGYLVTWVESHDTYCNEHESAGLTNEQIRLAWAVIAARAGGTPLFYSRPAGSNGSAGNYWGDNVLGAKGNNQFKATEVKEVNFFRNAMVGQNETLRNPAGNSKILQIDRGNKGSCIINLDSAVTLNNVTTSLKDGSYVDHVSGRTFTVSGGKLSGSLDGRKVAVLYNAQEQPASGGNSGSGSGGSAAGGSVTVSGDYDIYCSKPSAWGSTIYCYAYTSDGSQNAGWPGVKMTDLGNGLYGYNLPSGWNSANLIFNDGNNQDPASGQPGLSYTKGTPMVYQNGALVQAKTTYDLYFNKPGDWGGNIYCYAYTSDGSQNAGWPGVKMTDQGNGLFGYDLPAGWSSANVIFTDGSNQTPASGQPGLAYSKGGSKLYVNGNLVNYINRYLLGNYDIYIKKPAGWGSNLNCYIYSSSASGTSWPGDRMTDLGGDYYGYNLPSGWTSANVLFNDGSNQYPGSGQAGLSYTKGSSMIYDGSSFRAVW